MSWAQVPRLAFAFLVMTLSIPLSAQSGSAQAAAAKNSDPMCDVLSPADVQPFTGAAIPKFYETSQARECKWNGKVDGMVTVDIFKAVRDSKVFFGLNKSARNGATLKDEPGVGDSAYSIVSTNKDGFPGPGVMFYVMQKNQHLVLVWLDGKHFGTEKMRDALRVTAKKVVAANL